MTQPRTVTPPRPTFGIPCLCTWELRLPDPAKLRRFPSWWITTCDPECIVHGHTTRSTLAADLRFGD